MTTEQKRDVDEHGEPTPSQVKREYSDALRVIGTLRAELDAARAREEKLRDALTQIAHGGPLEGQRVASPMKMYQAQAVARAALAEGEDTPRPEVVEPPIQSVGQEPIKVANLMEALRRSLDAVLRQDPNMQVRAVRYSAEDK